ncbi:DUF6440 family protein [Gracilibacillus timonensis]|uniref:DUF6440 family protein n=1 Tax=Gracilibacillus timonensis TaxID=1816696 RepID=UPI000A90D930|nr:DUF6440 family protein [Gracilibacillus timonensis]
MFKSKRNENKRFYIKSELVKGLDIGQITILVDRETGVNYLHTIWHATGGVGMTPLLDENGKVIVDK